MAYLDQDALDVITKEVWGEKSDVWDWTNRGTPLLDYCESTDQIPFGGWIEGKYIAFAVKIAGNPNAAVGTRAGRGYATPGSQKYAVTRWNARKMSQSFGIDEESMTFVGGGEQSVVNAVTEEMDAENGQLADWRKKINRYMHGDGSGMLASVASCSGNIITLATGSDMSVFQEGQEIILRNKTGGGLTSGQTAKTALVIQDGGIGTVTLTVKNEDGTTPSITLAASTTEGVYDYDAQGFVPSGLGIHCSDSDPTNWGDASALYGNLSRATQGKWQGYRIAGVAGSTTATADANVQDHLDPALDKINERTGKKNMKLLSVMRYQDYNSIKWQLARDQRTDGTEKKLKFGHVGITYENCDIIKDYDAPTGKFRIFCPQYLRRYTPLKPRWEKQTGAIWHQQNESGTSRPAGVWRANLIGFSENCAMDCRAAVEVYNLTSTR